MNDRQLIEDLLSALEYHTEQTRPIEFSKVAIQAAREHLRKPEQPAQQESVACPVCNQVHTILDADESQIIRNAKDGYPDGRTPRLLTLQERVTALCQYASDWKRWCLEKENTTPQAQPARDWVGLTEAGRKEIEKQSVYVEGAIRMTEAKLKEKNT